MNWNPAQWIRRGLAVTCLLGYAQAQDIREIRGSPFTRYDSKFQKQHLRLRLEFIQFNRVLRQRNISYQPGGSFVVHCSGAGLTGPETIKPVVNDIIRKGKFQFLKPCDSIYLLPMPSFPPVADEAFGPLKLEVRPITPQKTGTRLVITVKVTNPTEKRYSLLWGEDTLNFVLFDAAGQPVRWRTRNIFNGIGLRTVCPPQSTCKRDIDTGIQKDELPLVSFTGQTPLKPGKYTLRVFVKDLKINGYHASGTLPDMTFDVVR